MTFVLGQKVKYHLISVNMSISKIFIPNFVCVVQMKDTKHIRRDFYSVTLVMPQGWDFGVPRGVNFFSNMVITGIIPFSDCGEFAASLVSGVIFLWWRGGLVP